MKNTTTLPDTSTPADYSAVSSYKGKRVMKGYQNALRKLHEAGICPLSKPSVMVNGVNGRSREIDGFSWSICNIVLFVAFNNLIGRSIQTTDENGKALGVLRLTQTDWDNLRYFLMAHESEVYYDFID